MAFSPPEDTPTAEDSQLAPPSCVARMMPLPVVLVPTKRHVDRLGHAIPLNDAPSLVDNCVDHPKQPPNVIVTRKAVGNIPNRRTTLRRHSTSMAPSGASGQFYSASALRVWS